MKRIVTAIVLVPGLVAIIGYAPPLVFFGLVIISSIIALEEFFNIARRSGMEADRISGHIACVSVLGALNFSAHDLQPAFLIVGITTCIILALGLRRTSLQAALAGSSATLLGLLYVPITLGMLVVVHRSHTPWGPGSRWVFFLLLTVWLGDTAAYYVGKTLGSHPLAPRVSPKKTIEGCVGGLFGNLVAAVVGQKIFLPLAPLTHLLVMSVILGVFSQIGDLSESAMKRSAGMKDSSRLLPGHGGMLDRIDGVLFASPVLLTYLSTVVGRS